MRRNLHSHIRSCHCQNYPKQRQLLPHQTNGEWATVKWVFPEDIKREYNIDALSENGNVLAEIITGMYVLPQPGIRAYHKLVKHLKGAGITPAKFTPGLFKHTTLPISFSLVVDDFGGKYINKEDAES